MDLIFLALGIVFFGLTLGFVRLTSRLGEE